MSLKIMVVDDEPKVTQLMRSLATPLGHTVLPFGDYQAAGQRGETQRFDVAFVGMRWPELGGLELARRMRNSQPNRETMDLPEWKGRRHAARLPLFTEVTCTWNEWQFPLRSLNISESGMLLQPAIAAEVGQEVALEFKIADVRASLNVLARIIRKEGERVGMEFVGLAPEDQNAIQLYVTGHLEVRTPREPLNLGTRRLFSP